MVDLPTLPASEHGALPQGWGTRKQLIANWMREQGFLDYELSPDKRAEVATLDKFDTVSKKWEEIYNQRIQSFGDDARKHVREELTEIGRKAIAGYMEAEELSVGYRAWLEAAADEVYGGRRELMDAYNMAMTANDMYRAHATQAMQEALIERLLDDSQKLQLERLREKGAQPEVIEEMNALLQPVMQEFGTIVHAYTLALTKLGMTGVSIQPEVKHDEEIQGAGWKDSAGY